NLSIMRLLFVVLLIASVVSAQLMPGSTNSFIANGKGGLGRYLRHLEGDRSYYAGNGNGFQYGYAPTYQNFGFFG
ncbi:hypothetical protein PENTCL1PPCAC_5094, partial [Pristionchus entomophagus]